MAEPQTAATAEEAPLPPPPAVLETIPPPSSGAIPGFEMLPDGPPQGLVRRFFTTQRHLFALAFGALVAHARDGHAFGESRRFRLLFWLERLLAFLVRPFLDKTIADRPFPVQLRRRLEILGPTYIKLGQVLALRQDILPPSITDELKNLLDRLPVVPFDRYLRLIEADIKRPIGEMYSWVDPIPTGSASIAQIHRATTLEGDSVIIKVVKPGIRETLNRDAILLRILGGVSPVPPPPLPAVAAHPRVRGVHAPGGGPAARGGQRGVLHGQLPRPAGGGLPQDLPAVQRPGRAVHGVPQGVQAGGAGDAGACRTRTATSWWIWGPRASSACSSRTVSSTPTSTRATC